MHENGWKRQRAKAGARERDVRKSHYIKRSACHCQIKVHGICKVDAHLQS